MPTDSAPAPVPAERHPALGPAQLKALAHPLRVQILDLLSTHGALTASRLADLVGESSGSTSYHLRQLARHGFVREVAGRGTARERWWERPPGGFTVDVPHDEEDAAATLAGAMVSREFESARARKIQAFLERSPELPTRWLDGSRLTTASMWLTADQMLEVAEAWDAFDATLQRFQGQEQTPGARPVQIHFNVFPTIDGKENPS
ncbi:MULTISPECIES: ArsR/SmtB family transcription factor [Cellulosimicrobium]|uniref:ArsR family transcriptional regulator n=1 Tax=Cellulosimicrobium funkei TaxID=264251 RepID=A0A4Y8R1W9_9MICO|nr:MULTISPECIES: helix-turn-helix domain-containing protein [Cellulosimicrobium]NMF28290.1 helix-turn-helix transcriptional regulator [Cellulosimicrobium aquatile]TFF08654.1 ArsR family transcriptional regulator [Cellulosimicrobium funkei]TGA73046.1 ArsR family transcriptional regulator [Cellulosimicrobium terreum]